MLTKFLQIMFGLYFLFIGVSVTWVIAVIFKKSVELFKTAIFNNQRALNFMKAVSSFDRHAELFYSALELINNEEQKQKLKTAWEDLLCK